MTFQFDATNNLSYADELKAILNAASDAIITINIEGRILHVNPATENMFGYSETELLDKNISILMPEPYARNYEQFIKRYRETGDTRLIAGNHDFVAKRKDGALFPVSLAMSRVDQVDCYVGIIRDMTARVRLEQDYLRAIEEERNRISRDIHDNVLQDLAGINLQMEQIARRLKRDGHEEAETLKSCAKSLQLDIAEMRNIIQDLSNLDLDGLDLHEAIAILVKRWRKFESTQITYDLNQTIDRLDNHTKNQLYKIVREALNNAIKHAQATHIVIKVDQSKESIRIEVSDDGKGFPNQSDDAPFSSLEHGMGLRNMRYRAHLIGAELKIESGLEKGTSVSCTVFTPDHFDEIQKIYRDL